MHDWLDWTNSGVGVAALAFTVGAVWQAVGAKRAANEAKDAVWQRESADSFSETGSLAAELAASLIGERVKEASVRIGDLLVRIPRDRERYKRFLGSDGDALSTVESVFRNLAVQLSSPDFLERRDEFKATIQDVLKANSVLSAIYGGLMTREDKEEK